jgi:hypothetical protein
MPRRERRSVLGAEPVGPYVLLRIGRGELDPGVPGQFFMLEAPGRLLPRALSLCLAPPGELAFLIDPIGPGTAALCELEQGDSIASSARQQRLSLDVDRPLLVGGGIGMAPLPISPSRASRGRAGSRAPRRSGCAPARCQVIDPAFVTELIPPGHDVLAASEPMLHAVAGSVPARSSRGRRRWPAATARCGCAADRRRAQRLRRARSCCA